MKRLLASVNFLVFALVFITQIDGKIDIKEAAGIWLYNEGEGNAIKDSSEKENHGKFAGTPELVEKGVFGAAPTNNLPLRLGSYNKAGKWTV